MHSFLLYSFFTLENIITMVSDDLFYHKIRDWIIGVQERVDEKDPLKEGAGGDGEVDIDDPAMNVEEKDESPPAVCISFQS